MHRENEEAGQTSHQTHTHTHPLPETEETVLYLGQRRLLQVDGVGHGHVGARHALGGGVQVVEDVRLGHQRGDLGAHAWYVLGRRRVIGVGGVGEVEACRHGCIWVCWWWKGSACYARTALGPALLHGDEPAGLAHRVQDRLGVQGAERPVVVLWCVWIDWVGWLLIDMKRGRRCGPT